MLVDNDHVWRRNLQNWHPLPHSKTMQTHNYFALYIKSSRTVASVSPVCHPAYLDDSEHATARVHV